MSAQSVMPSVAKTGTLTPQTQTIESILTRNFHLFAMKNKTPSSTYALNTITRCCNFIKPVM